MEFLWLPIQEGKTRSRLCRSSICERTVVSSCGSFLLCAEQEGTIQHNVQIASLQELATAQKKRFPGLGKGPETAGEIINVIPLKQVERRELEQLYPEILTRVMIR